MTPRTKTLLTALGLAAAPVWADTGTVTFQNGANGYAGTISKLVSSESPTAANLGTGTTLGVDGISLDNPTSVGINGVAGSPDVQGLLRFDDIFGATAAQIPAGATVLSASLRLTTQSFTTSASAESGGPWGVAGLRQAFDIPNTSYSSFVKNAADPIGLGGNIGPSYGTGTATRPLAGIGPTRVSVGNTTVDVTPLVRDWASGATPNYGFVVQAGVVGTTDGWIFRSGSHGTQSSHPVLSVTYTTNPTAVTHLQQGANGYAGTTMAYVQRDLTTDAQYISQDLLDLNDATYGDRTAVMRFDNLTDAKPTPSATLLSATLVVTTGTASDNARSPGEWSLDALGANFTADTPYADFGAAGPAGTQLSSVTGMISDSQARFDVTAYVQAVLAGGDNFGWALRSSGTTDGWMIHFTGSEDVSARPDLQLVWSTAASTPEPTAMTVLAVGGMTLLRRRRA